MIEWLDDVDVAQKSVEIIDGGLVVIYCGTPGETDETSSS